MTMLRTVFRTCTLCEAMCGLKLDSMAIVLFRFVATKTIHSHKAIFAPRG